jgi:hypothetical protein
MMRQSAVPVVSMLGAVTMLLPGVVTVAAPAVSVRYGVVVSSSLVK